jgi:hypothetical protein
MLADGTQARVLHAIPSNQSAATLSFVPNNQTSVGSLITEDGQLLLTDMYSLYQPVLSGLSTDMGHGTTSVNEGYQVLAAASEGHVMLTEVRTKIEKCSDDGDNDVDEDVDVAAQTLEGVVSGSDLTGSLDIMACNVST